MIQVVAPGRLVHYALPTISNNETAATWRKTISRGMKGGYLVATPVNASEMRFSAYTYAC